MWAEACALLDEAERRHRRFFDLLSAPAASPAWEPPVNIFSNGTEWSISIALPGAREQDIDIQLTASGLLIETSVAPPSFPAGMHVVRLEVPYGRMRRRIDLPPGRYTVREHHLESGHLHLRLSGSPR